MPSIIVIPIGCLCSCEYVREDENRGITHGHLSTRQTWEELLAGCKASEGRNLLKNGAKA